MRRGYTVTGLAWQGDLLAGNGRMLLDLPVARETTDHLTVRRTQTSTEYWQRHGSLAHTDTRGNDLPQPAGVRIYMWASSQHFADPLLKKPERGVCQNFLSTYATSMLFRAMIDAIDRRATTRGSIPESRIPRRADGTRVTIEEWRREFPEIPGSPRHARRARCRC